MGRGLPGTDQDSSSKRDVDLLLPTPLVKRRHLGIEFGPQGNVFAWARYSVRIDGQEVPQNSRHLLDKDVHILQVATLDFELRRIRPSRLDIQYHTALKAYIAENRLEITAHPSLSVPPTRASYTIGGEWLVSGVVGQGGHDGEG